jgi:hypothetical protein
MGGAMPDATFYCRQSEVLRSTASQVTDPAVARRLRALAADYQAIAALLTNADAEVTLHVAAPPTAPRAHRGQS